MEVRVWYVEDSGPIAAKIKELVQTRVDGGVDPGDQFWRITPFIDFAKPHSTWEDWRWEREWRVPGGLSFTPEDVAFLFLPEGSHEDARQFFVGHQAASASPAYLCPYVNTRWPRDRIEESLNEVPSAPEPSPGARYDPLDDWNDPHPFGV
jgi:hypothetical protein